MFLIFIVLLQIFILPSVMGFGYRETTDDTVCTSTTATLAECLRLCFVKREDDKTYNGVYYYFPENYCCCTKNERGHQESNNYLHYKYFPRN